MEAGVETVIDDVFELEVEGVLDSPQTKARKRRAAVRATAPAAVAETDKGAGAGASPQRKAGLRQDLFGAREKGEGRKGKRSADTSVDQSPRPKRARTTAATSPERPKAPSPVRKKTHLSELSQAEKDAANSFVRRVEAALEKNRAVPPIPKALLAVDLKAVYDLDL